MLYTVECTFTDNNSENEWNDFYNLLKLPALISVTGFKTSQRFKSLTPGCPTYLAIHSIEDKNVISSNEYKEKGGGNFSRWQPFITDWYRNLYETDVIAPTVSSEEILLLSARLLPLDSLKPVEMNAVGLDEFPAYRVAYVLPRKELDEWLNVEGTLIYEPITVQLQSSENS
ncbi:sugar ABC transporter [Acinetobacter calcoaceticus]|uniref:sugar ABC transporter n=1 Tax=Acinetobacter calcoaceticus TaxID=471 RepID=UPI00192AF492|nr:sugar ABC transporter [Acinetobacter calcoaceticus]